jgi:hypothetical protein
LWRANDLAVAGTQGLFGQSLVGCLGDAEVDHFRHGTAVVERDKHIGGLDIAMDNTLLVGVLDRMADIQKQSQAGVRRETVAVAVVGDGDAAD